VLPLLLLLLQQMTENCAVQHRHRLSLSFVVVLVGCCAVAF
jgi:hypothetical protein